MRNRSQPYLSPGRFDTTFAWTINVGALLQTTAVGDAQGVERIDAVARGS